jgi:quercetin dioxygenase-like cupin family protein
MIAIACPIVSMLIGGSQMKTYVEMYRTIFTLAVFAAVGVGGMTLAQHAEHTEKAGVKVTELSRREIIEKLDGNDASATVLEVAFGPGEKDTRHRHAGPVFGYVLEGEYEHAIDDEPVKTYKAGDTFYEPTGCIHRVAANPSSKTKTRLLVVILHPRDAKEVTVWDKDDH